MNEQARRDALVDEIFDRALDAPEEQIASLLDGACDGDEELRDSVERLLRWNSRPPPIFAAGALARGPSICQYIVEAERQLPGPDHIGPYRILQEIGRGGMGVVYLAERDDGHFEQRVALKVLHPGTETSETLRRFEQERQIIASFSHRNIARLYDGGVSEDGRPYSAMEYVEGLPIDRYCDEHRLDLSSRLKLFEVVADAVHYAHQNLVVHRDLKPSNILVTVDGEIKLLDFGIAKLLDVAGLRGGQMTRTGGLPMTPRYASPEQLRGEAVTTASDVFQLGLLLFELLSGEPARCERKGSPAEVADALRFEQDMNRRPSTALRKAPGRRASATAAARSTTPRVLERSLRSELDLIVLAALRPDATRRYRSAAELAEDSRRYRGGFPLSARPDSFTYRARRFSRRHRAGIGVALIFLSLLIAYSVTVTLQARKIARERDRAERIQAFALGLYGAADPNLALGPELSASDLVAHGVDRVDEELAGEPELQAEVYAHLAWIYLRLGRFDEAEPLFRKVLATRQRLHGKDHPATAAAMNDLGELLLRNGNPEAYTLFSAALEQRRHFLGEDHQATARTLSNLGKYLRSESRYQEAEGFLREALQVQRQVQDGSAEVADALAELAWVLNLTSRSDEAETLLAENLKINRETHGETHPEVATAFNNLASTLWRLERWTEGDLAMERSIKIQRNLYGQEHPHIATSLANTAGSFRRRGDLVRSRDLYGQALAMHRSVLGERHLPVARDAAQLAEVLTEMGDLEAPLPLFELSLEIFREHLPEGHTSFGRVLRGLGTLWLSLGELEPALEALRQSRKIYSENQLTSWPPRLDVLIAQCRRRQGQLAEAESLLLTLGDQLLEDPSWQRRWLEERAEVAVARGRDQEARDLRKKAAELPD